MSTHVNPISQLAKFVFSHSPSSPFSSYSGFFFLFFFPLRLFYLTAQAADGSGEEDRGCLEDGARVCVDFLLTRLTRKISHCYDSAGKIWVLSVAMCAARLEGWVGARQRQQRAGMRAEMEQKIFPSVTTPWIMHHPSLKRLPPLTAHPLKPWELRFGWAGPVTLPSPTKSLLNGSFSSPWWIWADRWQWCLNGWPMDPHFSS